MVTVDTSCDNNDVERRAEEYEALSAFYGDDVHRSSKKTNNHSECWSIRVSPKVVLELNIPLNYPSQQAPTPCIEAPQYVLDHGRISSLVEEMIDMWSEDTDVAILWAEHLRAELPEEEKEEDSHQEVNDDNNDDDDDNDQPAKENNINETQQQQPPPSSSQDDGTITFVPPTTRYNQPIRHFEASVISNEANRRDIFRGAPFHPPKSGPSETLVAHVASVHSMDHVHWVLAELLFQDKKVAKATHNMIAYKFWDETRNCMVSDNDDDGEKGAGTKLAALLEMSNARNVIVVVSRWFGGVLLGPSRFKYIASTARDALLEAGFLDDNNNSSNNNGDENSNNNHGKRKGRK